MFGLSPVFGVRKKAHPAWDGPKNTGLRRANLRTPADELVLEGEEIEDVTGRVGIHPAGTGVAADEEVLEGEEIEDIAQRIRVEVAGAGAEVWAAFDGDSEVGRDRAAGAGIGTASCTLARV
ncbi:MAG: hypothetical protein IH985_06900 [Planctomycetes bacterium]|nr:hypothetical protein [Planctomycetota bacterium]